MQHLTPELITNAARRLFHDAAGAAPGIPGQAGGMTPTPGLAGPAPQVPGPISTATGLGSSAGPFSGASVDIPSSPQGWSVPATPSGPATPELPTGVRRPVALPGEGSPSPQSFGSPGFVPPLPGVVPGPPGSVPGGTFAVDPTGTVRNAASVPEVSPWANGSAWERPAGAVPGMPSGTVPSLPASLLSENHRTGIPGGFPAGNPSAPQIPSAFPSAVPNAFASTVPSAPPTSFSGASLQSMPHVVPNTISVGRGAEAPAPAASPAPDGLKAFIARIREEDYRQAALLCPQQQQQRARTGKSINGPRPLDVDAIRRDFPILNQSVHGKPLVWLDNAATTQKPQSVIDALADFYAHDNSNIHRAAHALAARATDAYEGARQMIQKFLGAGQPEEVVFVRGTTEGVNLIANTYGRKHLQAGDEIILSQLEHHANIVPWQMLAREKGLTLRVIPVNDRGEVLLEAYQALLGPRTRLVSLTHASNSLGTILPVAEMTAMAKRYGATVVIDGAQTVAHLAVNVQALNCDFYVFSGHKIFGPTGIGAVFGRREVWEDLPPWQGGGNMIRNVTFEETAYSDPPARFEAGTPNIADAVGLGAALDYVQQFGLASIAAYEHDLLQAATEALVRIPGLRLIGTAAEKVGVLSFVLKNQRVEDVGRQLDQEGIAVRAGHHCAQPSLRRFGVEATVRPSLSFYNTRAEIDYLADAVRRIARRTSP